MTLDGVVLTNTWDGKGTGKYFKLSTGELQPGWVRTDLHPPLVSFLFWLHTSIPRFAVRTSGLMHYLLAGSTWTPTDTGETAIQALFSHGDSGGQHASRAEEEGTT